MFDKNAILILNKPTGMSSFLAVKRTIRLLGVKKAGHMGTLDPLGSGVLLIGLNNGTKLFEEYLKKDKTYIATFHFGYETDTLDSEGKIINQNDIKVTKEMVEMYMQKLVGNYPQMPPIYSAKKVNGKKACDIARCGGEVELKPKTITVYSIKLLDELGDNNFRFEICCSAGTYIRSICRDLAYSMSTYGTMLCIIRTRCGKFDIVNSCTLQEIESGVIKYEEV